MMSSVPNDNLRNAPAARYERGGIVLRKDDEGIWFTVDDAEPRWIGPRTIAALRASGFVA